MSQKKPRKSSSLFFGNDDDDSSQRLSVDDAAEIWASRGMDEEDTFGYDEDELRKAFDN